MNPALLMLMRSRAAASWTPASLPSLAAWFDASDTATITESAGRVSQWNDKSGNGRHVTQATGTLQPYTGRTANGLSVMDFRGAHHMSLTGVSVGSVFTIGVVYQFDSATPPAYTYYGSLNNTRGDGVMGSSAGWPWQMSASSLIQHTTTKVGGSHHSHIGVFNGASSSYRVDGVTVAGNTGAATSTGIHLGAWDAPSPAAYKLDGFIAEVIIYASALSTASVEALHIYLKTKWGTP